jgi:hypothetical protein
MRKYRKMEEDLDKEFNDLKENRNEVQKQSENFIVINEKRLENFNNLDEIIKDIDKEFSEKTGILNKKDQTFLWTAVALQTTRIYLLDKLTKIEKAGKGEKEKYLKELQEKIFKNNFFQDKNNINNLSSKYYASLEQIITTLGVPYDATRFYQDKKLRLFKGANHRFATLGHDPILGYVFGTSNILTNTITCVEKTFKITDKIYFGSLSTNHVDYNELFKNPIISDTNSSTIEMFQAVLARFKNDKKSIVASIIKQTIHIATDLYTPKGIQFPMANLVLSKKNVENITKYISTGDIVKTWASVKMASFINFLIATIHSLLYDKNIDNSRDIYSVRTSKIIYISNSIATSSNIILTIFKAYTQNNILPLKELDIGGIFVAISSIFKNKKLQERIRREYLEEKLYEKFFIEKKGDENE